MLFGEDLEEEEVSETPKTTGTAEENAENARSDVVVDGDRREFQVRH